VVKTSAVDRVAGTASVADSSVVVDTVAVAHVGDIEVIPALDLADTSLAAVLMVEAIVVVVLVDYP
jgi:hypothetical protein